MWKLKNKNLNAILSLWFFDISDDINSPDLSIGWVIF